MVNAWVFFRISGALFNPALLIAMLVVRALTVARAACLFVAQMSGALLASAIVRYLFPESFNVRTTLGGGASIVQGLFVEVLLTARLGFTILMLAKKKHRATFLAPVGIGLALFISELIGVQYTGGSLNPARSFAPCVITGTFDKEHWIYCKFLAQFTPCATALAVWGLLFLFPLAETSACIVNDMTLTSTRAWTLRRGTARCPVLPVHQDARIRGKPVYKPSIMDVLANSTWSRWRIQELMGKLPLAHVYMSTRLSIRLT
jgi:hypothetical protein